MLSTFATGLYSYLMNFLIFAQSGVTTGKKAWNVFDMFKSMQADGESLVGYIAGFLAVVLFGFAAFKFAQAVMSQQGRGANVGVAIAALVVGGFLGFAAYSRIAGLSQGAGTTIENWGTGNTNSTP